MGRAFPIRTPWIVTPYSAQLHEGLDPAAPIKVLINDVEAIDLPAR